MVTSSSKDKVFEAIEAKGVKFVRLWFTDILGLPKSFAISPSELEGAFDEGMGFDGSSIQGFARIEESDMVAKPDPETFTILPWRAKEGQNVGRMFCDILQPNGSPYEGDPRYVLKKNLAALKDMGYDLYVGPELEYFYFKDDKSTEILDKGGYFDAMTTMDAASNLRRDTILTLESMGVNVEYSHHEVAPSQHEIDLRYQEALKMADIVMTYRIVVKEIAQQHGYYATFMPKPIFGENGTGMHVHQSLFKGGRNAFFDPGDKYNLSDIGKHYIAGLLKNAPVLTAVTNQWVNSYKRLVPGYEAPVYISWARRNRSALVRMPMYKPGKENATRVEYRSPDPGANPYLAFAVMLAAGVDGIKNKYELPEPIERDIFKMTEAEKEKAGITSLPGSLIEALMLTENSSLMKETLGDHVFTNFIASKKVEWDEYRTDVSRWEIEKYLPLL
ncbi:MAG: type I glutamate--ammonia ligase [Methanothrix sp.]|jgi:L-glutamine synthetase (EC 6.3.1.2)|uniref:Glutamate--ammonia ligase n=3 Tax=Methanothrix harundinacea TaxID=301375 RepID=A0A124G3R7_9EURY|nr:MAG: Glutamine synthase [Methanothrix harundinacea]MDD2637447.1 type I glutamate--ammonia ligase [Methanothrix sp.]MDD3709199.1 type I glutamate--ammonia ligase [Methanothrix sp.]MDD5767033.1 type I glutamate--ammonia ligase [Methanothrix sp.]